jgi:23S rRNA pseudouridine1911/1915/1917 synthase
VSELDPTSVRAPDEAEGQRLDKWLADQFPALSRARLKPLIEKGRVWRDEARVTDPSAKVKAGALYRLDLPPPEAAEDDPQPEAIALTVLFEDSHVLVIDKPAGLSVHPAPGNWTGTLVNAVLAHCGESLRAVGAVGRPGIVHRLDKETSGVMVVAKSAFAMTSLGRQFHDRTAQRLYRAFTVGAPPKSADRIAARLARDPHDRKKMAVIRDDALAGKPAATRYRVTERFGAGFGGRAGPAAAAIECTLETGRTHQVRVHMAHVGAPLIGDPVYGGNRAARALDQALPEDARLTRQALHAAMLAFTHPESGERLQFETALPDDMRRLEAALQAMPAGAGAP